MLILALIVFPFALWEELQQYSKVPALASGLRVAYCLASLCFVGSVTWGIARVAASITDAAQNLHLAAHDLVGRVAVVAPEQLHAAKDFSDYLGSECDRIGFRSFGIVLNSGTVARVIYTSLVALFGVGSFVLQREHGDGWDRKC